MFQSTVNINQAFGIIGEIYKSGTLRAQPGIIDSTGTVNPNRIGRAFTNVAGADGHMTVGGAGGVFAGILANPKVEALNGTVAGGTLAASLDLPQYYKGEFVYATTGVVVQMENAANIGDTVDFDTTTGQLYARTESQAATAATLAITSNVGTVAGFVAGSQAIGVGTVLNTVAGPATVLSLGTGTGGNGTYNLSMIANQGATVFSYNTAPVAGRQNIPRSKVQFFSIPAAGLAVIELTF